MEIDLSKVDAPKRILDEVEVRLGSPSILVNDELEARALALGYTKLHLDTSVVQLAAQKLYMKNGFKETGREVHQGLECILFEKSIG